MTKSLAVHPGHSRWPFTLVCNVQLDIRGLATYGDVLLISTEVVGSRQVWVRRRSEVVRVAASSGPAERDLLAVVETDWVLLTTAGRPARVPPEIARYFAPARPFTRDRISLPEPNLPVSSLTTRVRPLDVDPMRHMNNAAYLDMVDDALGRLPDGTGIGRPDCYRVGYTAPALPGTAIEIRCWAVTEARVACHLSDSAGRKLMNALVSRKEPGAQGNSQPAAHTSSRASSTSANVRPHGGSAPPSD